MYEKTSKILVCVCAVVARGVGIFFFGFAPSLVADSLNPVILKPPYVVSERAKALHEKLFVADMHADSLLWRRDLLEKSSIGQVDVPRLIKGNLARPRYASHNLGKRCIFKIRQP